MKEPRHRSSSLLALAALLVLPGQSAAGQAMPAESQVEHGQQQAPARTVTGKVLETMDAGSYTYALVDTDKGKIWIAAYRFDVDTGDTVTFPPGAPMPGFHSKSLDRTFDLIYFVPAVAVAGGQDASSRMPPGHANVGTQSPADIEIDLSGIEKADGGWTVGEVYAGKKQLAGKEVVVRGKVVKANEGIMGKNWLHLRDGTGEAGSNDLLVSTQDTARVGDTVVARGTVATDKDLGYGYRFTLILENTTITVESR